MIDNTRVKRVLLLCALFLAAVLGLYRGDIVTAWRERRYHWRAATPVGPQGQAILAEIRDQRAKAVSKEYGRIRVKMDAARAKGFQVDSLEPTLTLALQWARAGKFREALLLLNTVEMRIPREKERVVPAAEGEGFVSEQPDRIPVGPVRKTKKKKKTVRKRARR